MSKPVVAVQAITLPSWTDPTSLAMYLTTLASTVIAVVTIVHPGFTVPSTTVEAIVGGVSILVAGAAQIYNAVRHTSATKAAITAGIPAAVNYSKAKTIIAPQPVPSLGNVTGQVLPSTVAG